MDGTSGAMAQLAVSAQSKSFPSNYRNKDTHCPRKVEAKNSHSHILQKLRFQISLQHFFNSSLPSYLKFERNLQASVILSRAYRKQYPWIALILVMDADMNERFQCTGIAITSVVMLTAAVCTPEDDDSILVILMGFDEQSKAGLESRSVTFVYKREIRIHPGGEIALFPYKFHRATVEKPTHIHRKFPLLHRKKGTVFYGKTKCMALGFGIIDPKKQLLSRYLQKLALNITVEEETSKAYYSYDRGGVCIVDSGAPILCTVEGQLTLVAINVGNNAATKNLYCDWNGVDFVMAAENIIKHHRWIELNILSFTNK